jgi:hypothetical protein
MVRLRLAQDAVMLELLARLGTTPVTKPEAGSADASTAIEHGMRGSQGRSSQGCLSQYVEHRMSTPTVIGHQGCSQLAGVGERIVHVWLCAPPCCKCRLRGCEQRSL